IWFWDVFANIYASYSDIDGGWPSSNVINVAPLYTDLGNGNLLLQAGSPCLQAGSHAAPNCHATDFDGLIRGNPPSMGAFDN
ncbi:MAG TPA: hypothetical protein VKU00_00665, partial [Chthonomonadaceae bacterium]|nr:hypothetical protein [Chthonomonadaceae bacterium]